jgi:site-specific DNA-methyltransferase (adenine-specific)
VNYFYYGDNLDVLRLHIKDDTADLVYLDPPFNSNQDYNVLFAEKDGTRAASQFAAFEDTWEWNIESVRVFEELVESGGRVSDVMRAFRQFLGTRPTLSPSLRFSSCAHCSGFSMCSESQRLSLASPKN